ncbi:triose-phosphate isomerase family protein [Streptomyces flaveolus]|uniref:triose-phosphate isomerase n=1 Tax=Streptomyces flaveolus TaxID=67297 RepID=UPI0033D8022F
MPQTTPSTTISCTSTKMNLGLADTLRWLDTVILPLADKLAALSFFACLPHPLVIPACERLDGSGVTVGAQDVWFEGGAVTGAVSPSLLAEMGCTHVMVGHAERRRLFQEDDDLVARKAAATARAGMTPLICVGEKTPRGPLAAAEYVVAQAKAALENIRADQPALVLYEPVWAIGGDTAADPEDAGHVLRALRAATDGRDVRFLYGGAVVPGIYSRLRQVADWDGVALGRVAQDAGVLAETVAELLDDTETRARLRTRWPHRPDL